MRSMSGTLAVVLASLYVAITPIPSLAFHVTSTRSTPLRRRVMAGLRFSSPWESALLAGFDNNNSNSSPISENDVRVMYDEWRVRHQKGPYDGYRYKIWKANFWAIQRRNDVLSLQARRWKGEGSKPPPPPPSTAATTLNAYGDLTQEEYKTAQNILQRENAMELQAATATASATTGNKAQAKANPSDQQTQSTTPPNQDTTVPPPSPHYVGLRPKTSQHSRALRNDQSTVMHTSVPINYSSTTSNQIVQSVGPRSLSSIPNQSRVIQTKDSTSTSSSSSSSTPLMPALSPRATTSKTSTSLRNDQGGVMATSPTAIFNHPQQRRTLGISDNDMIVHSRHSKPRASTARTSTTTLRDDVEDTAPLTAAPSPAADAEEGSETSGRQLTASSFQGEVASTPAVDGTTKHLFVPSLGPRSTVSQGSTTIRNDQRSVMNTSPTTTVYPQLEPPRGPPRSTVSQSSRAIRNDQNHVMETSPSTSSSIAAPPPMTKKDDVRTGPRPTTSQHSRALSNDQRTVMATSSTSVNSVTNQPTRPATIGISENDMILQSTRAGAPSITATTTTTTVLGHDTFNFSNRAVVEEQPIVTGEDDILAATTATSEGKDVASTKRVNDQWRFETESEQRMRIWKENRTTP